MTETKYILFGYNNVTLLHNGEEYIVEDRAGEYPAGIDIELAIELLVEKEEEWEKERIEEEKWMLSELRSLALCLSQEAHQAKAWEDYDFWYDEYHEYGQRLFQFRQHYKVW